MLNENADLCQIHYLPHLSGKVYSSTREPGTFYHRGTSRGAAPCRISRYPTLMAGYPCTVLFISISIAIDSMTCHRTCAGLVKARMMPRVQKKREKKSHSDIVAQGSPRTLPQAWCPQGGGHPAARWPLARSFTATLTARRHVPGRAVDRQDLGRRSAGGPHIAPTKTNPSLES